MSRILRNAVLAGLSLAPLAVGCGGGTETSSSSSAEVEAVDSGFAARVPAAVLDQAWPVQLATMDSVQPFVANEGWADLVMKRNVRSAVERLGPEGGLTAARAHAEASILFRQAALVAAQAYIQTYGKTPKEFDPAELSHTLYVSYVLVGKSDKATEYKAKISQNAELTVEWQAPWSAWTEGGAGWPPDLSGLPIELPEKKAGLWPALSTEAHYQLPEQGGSQAVVSVGDPSALFALALWHEAVAKSVAGDQAELVDVFCARYRLPGEPAVTSQAQLPLEFLFGSELLHPGDGAFLAELLGEDGSQAVVHHQDKSLLAAMAAESSVEGALDSEKALDLAALYRSGLLDLLKEKGGEDVPFHRTFADITMVGAMRGLAVVAETQGDRRTSGILRINAMERSVDEAANAAGLLSLAAWDAENRYPMRAAEIIHVQSRRYPSLEITRYALDVLSVRVGLEQGSGGPGY